MQEKYVYEFAIIRVVPKVEREEFINVGLILFSKRMKYIRFQYTVHTNKILSLCPDFDIEQLKENLDSFHRICIATKDAGPIAQLDTDERFRWITAVKSSSIQSSRPHPGLSDNLDQTFEQLYKEMIV